MTYFLFVVFVVVISFSFVVLFGAPYLPVMTASAEQAIDLLDLKEGQTIIDLGSGEGKILRLAAKRNLNVIGYELNPILFLISYLSTRRYGRRVKIVYGNFWSKEIPSADAIFVFLLPKYMEKLDEKISKIRLNHGLKLVSYSFQIPGKKPYLESNNLFFYQYNQSS